MGNSFLTKLKAQLLLLGSNPIVAWLVRQVTTCAVAYYGTAPFTPQAWQKWAVNGVVFIVSGVVHAFDVWLSQQVANGVTPGTPTPVAPAPAPVSSHIGTLKAMLKMVVLLVGGLFLFASSAFAQGWDLPGRPFGIKNTVGASLSDNSNGQVHLVALPTESLGYNFGIGGAPAYGIAGGYSLELTNVTASNGQAKLSPIIGAGFSGFLDFAPWINSAGANPVEADLGFNANGPDLSNFSSLEIVPTASFTWNLNSGEKKFLVGPTAAFNGTFLDSLIVDILRVF